MLPLKTLSTSLSLSLSLILHVFAGSHRSAHPRIHQVSLQKQSRSSRTLVFLLLLLSLFILSYLGRAAPAGVSTSPHTSPWLSPSKKKKTKHTQTIRISSSGDNLRAVEQKGGRGGGGLSLETTHAEHVTSCEKRGKQKIPLLRPQN